MTEEQNTSRCPLLSIVIPCYNVEAYLKRGLDSLNDARFEGSLEVIIVNDGSRDATEQIAQKYVKEKPRLFSLISKENGGHGSGINRGISEARGKYFRIVDGDDWVNTENLLCLLEKLDDIDADIVVDEKTEVDMKTERKLHCTLPSYIKTGTERPFEEVCNYEDTESFMSIHTLSVRTNLLRQFDIHVLEKVFYEDYEYVVKTTCYARSVVFLDLDVYQYLVGNIHQSVAAENYVKRYEQHQRILNELLEFSKLSNFTPEVDDYLDKKIELLINTHYNILLIFDTDRAQGLARAKEFRRWLKDEYPRFASSTDKRYKQAFILHKLCFDKIRLDKFMGRN